MKFFKWIRSDALVLAAVLAWSVWIILLALKEGYRG